jgi:oligosaccharyltransferase complex subunit alpha (ribophorin I)
MRSLLLRLSCFAAISGLAAAAQSNSSGVHISKQILPSNFKPPQVFKNTNLVRNINLDKEYARETINVIIENIDSKPQDEYYYPFESETLARVGGFEVRDKKDASLGLFQVEVVEYDTERYDLPSRYKLPFPAC